MDFLKSNWIGLVAMIIAILGCYLPVQSAVQSLGGVTNYDTLGVTGLQVGAGCNSSFGTCVGTTIARINTGQCFFAPGSATTIAATSTASVDCQATAASGASGESALTGVTLGDNVVITLSTTTAQVTAGTAGGLIVAGASASTTAGFITVRLSNLTGTTFTWPLTGAASGTASYIVTK